MNDHTPGPWTSDAPETRFRHDESLGVRGPNGMYVAAAFDFNRSDRDDEVAANARLIAAAPDLLAAVGSAIWVFNNLHNASTAQFRTFAEAALADCREALAKTKGDTQ